MNLDEKYVHSVWERKKKDFEDLLGELAWLRNGLEFPLDSKIINVDQYQKLKKLLPKEPNSFELLYRASDNQFLAKKFHEKCDGIENTVTIVETEFGKIIGGYTPLKW